MRIRNYLILFSLVIWMLSSCSQGMKSEKPPIHINPNMDTQEKYKANRKSYFFADGAVNRLPVEGTVATTELFENTEYYYGKTEDGKFVVKAPVVYDEKMLKRGKQRFAIFCTPCHGIKGDGTGIVVSKEYKAPPSFYDIKIRKYPDGQIFDIMSNGFKNMPSYKHQIPVEDRWAILGYVRFLQRSQPVVVDSTSKQASDTLATH